MDTAAFPPLFTFNSWANEHIRTALTDADEARLRRPLGLWFGSVLDILAHLVAGETVWLARLRDGGNPSRLATAADFPSVTALVEHWRALDAAWESYVAGLTPGVLDEELTWRSQLGDSHTHRRWQLVMHVPFHSSEHRAHAATGLSLLGISHGPQDFHLQFMPPDAVATRQASPPPPAP